MRWRLLSKTTQLDAPIVASSQVHSVREHLYLELEEAGMIGYGEISPQPEPLNGDAGIGEIISEWETHLSVSFEEICRRENQLPEWFRASRIAGPRSSANFASAMLEMALLDLELKRSGQSLGEVWASKFETAHQFTVSGISSGEWLVPRGVQRLRVKLGGEPISDEAISRIENVGIPVILDFNCAAASIDSVIDAARKVGQLVDAVEQPFAVGNFVDHALLASEIGCRVSLDEGIRNLSDLQLASRHRAASLVCVKPARVGGFANARAIVQKAAELGIASYVGGYFESPLARNVNAMFARNMTIEPSDTSWVNASSGCEADFQTTSTGHGLVLTEDFLNHCRVIATSTISL